jgi:acyl-CoA thioesterase
MKAPADPDALARACADLMWADDRASPAMGMVIEAIGPGSARMAMTVAPQMVNGHGLCHGGYIFSLADSTMAFACNSRNEKSVAQHCSITFLRPAKLGMRLVATAREMSRAGRTGIFDVTVTADEGAVIAEFRGASRGLGSRFFED